METEGLRTIRSHGPLIVVTLALLVVSGCGNTNTGSTPTATAMPSATTSVMVPAASPTPDPCNTAAMMQVPALPGVNPVPTSTITATSVAANGLLKSGTLAWGADATGGAPYVFPDPNNPSNLIGFEVDIANAIAGLMGVKAKMVQTSWDTLPQQLQAKQFDLIMNGLEITPERMKTMIFAQPYYVYTEQVVVRSDKSGINCFKDLEGKTVGTGTGYKAADYLQADPKITTKLYDTDLPFDDLAAGRLDAVFIDLPIASYYALPNPQLKFAGQPIDPGYYGIAFTKENTALEQEVDEALTILKQNGTLRQIYVKWKMWSPQQTTIGIQ